MRSGKEEGGWISVGELEEAFEAGSYAPPHCRELAGRRLRLCLDGGGAVEYEFGDAELRWRNASAEVSGWVEEKYYAAKVREGVYFVDHLRHLERAASMSIVVDFNLGGFIAVVGRLPTGGEAKEPYAHRALKELELTRVKATVLRGSINGRGLPPPRYEATGELVGKRAEYAYSPTQRYEHIYLNKRFYTWHCLSGAERSATGEWGLADTDA
ncbi:MAG: MoaF N-terminal domain-containing protein, partial [Desulfurococcaceae archaeon]